MANSNLSKSKQKEIKDLIETGRKQGYLTVSAINDLLPDNQFDSTQIEQISSVSKLPQMLQFLIESAVVIKDSAKGFINDSGCFKRFKAILLADLGPIPGRRESNEIKLSISELFIYLLLYHYFHY